MSNDCKLNEWKPKVGKLKGVAGRAEAGVHGINGKGNEALKEYHYY